MRPACFATVCSGFRVARGRHSCRKRRTHRIGVGELHFFHGKASEAPIDMAAFQFFEGPSMLQTDCSVPLANHHDRTFVRGTSV